METWEAFLERMLARLHDLRRRGVKYNLIISGGRHDKETGFDLPPVFQIQEFDPHR